jgi:hypothetical protein
MVNRSSDKTESVRVTAAESDAARDALHTSRWEIGDILRAVVVALGRRPAAVLEFLEPDLREKKKAGRPRKATPPAE